jgi:hypothetical protein
MITPHDPGREQVAAKAAGLLLRIGFALLVIVIPVASVVSRRAVFILAPVGALIIIIASALMEETPDPRSGLQRLVSGPVGLAATFLAAWSGLSLAWTPFPAEAAERLFNVVGAAALAFGAAIALPTRMRATNLYLIPIGAGLGALLLLLALLRAQVPGEQTLVRASITVSLLAWPGICWLAMKRRSVPAMLVAALVGFAALVGRVPETLPALLVGSVVLGGAMMNRQAAGQAVGLAMAAMVLGAPLVVLLAARVFAGQADIGPMFDVWAQTITAEPLRLITGHGLDAALRGRFTNLLDTAAPRSILFEIWYELGVLGAVALAVALATAATRVAAIGPIVSPFALGAMTTGFVLSVLGLGTAQSWWLSVLGITAVAFAGVANGQYRTVRPRSLRPMLP